MSNSAAITPSTPGVLPSWLSERPSVSSAKEWFRLATPSLLPDWASLVAGRVPRSLIAYQPRTVPPALVATPPPPAGAAAVVGAIGEAQVAARDALIVQVTDENAIRASQLESHTAELEHAFFNAIACALRDNAPLLLNRLESLHPLAFSASMFSGSAAWRSLLHDFVSNAADALVPEDLSHEDHLTALRLKPLADNCTAQCGRLRCWLRTRRSQLAFRLPL